MIGRKWNPTVTDLASEETAADRRRATVDQAYSVILGKAAEGISPTALRKAINAGPDTVDAILGELKTAGKVRVDDLVSRGRPAKRIFATADLGFLV